MAEDKEPFRLKMIKIEDMIDALTELWSMGVEYVDVSGTKGEDQDEVCFGYCKSYMHPDHQDQFDESLGIDFDMDEDLDLEEDKPTQVKVTLTDKDINDLI